LKIIIGCETQVEFTRIDAYLTGYNIMSGRYYTEDHINYKDQLHAVKNKKQLMVLVWHSDYFKCRCNWKRNITSKYNFTIISGNVSKIL
jgi:hypothetical protein